MEPNLVFQLTTDDNATSVSVPRGDQAHTYKHAFVSYSSQDREKVLDRVQMLEVTKTPYFMDCLSLTPGERWEKRLYENIDACDLFVLFWSEAASRSEYVLKEVEYAVRVHQKRGDGIPDIVPVVLEPISPPRRTWLCFTLETEHYWRDPV